MKMLLAIIVTAVGAVLTGMFLPWWSIAVVAAAVAVRIRQHPPKATLSGFLGIAIPWAIMAAGIDLANDSILSRRIAQTLPLDGSPVLLILVTACVGGLVGASAAWFGSTVVARNG
ncbi:MAG: hypothetical protein FGM24_08920 [Candidatus Kapabacteria bacterium]|nr:hypothetical protein [Candidatus Kapabacteria bacterium]